LFLFKKDPGNQHSDTEFQRSGTVCWPDSKIRVSRKHSVFLLVYKIAPFAKSKRPHVSQDVLAVESNHLCLQWSARAVSMRQPGSMALKWFASSRLRPCFGRNHDCALAVYVLACTACKGGSPSGGSCVETPAQCLLRPAIPPTQTRSDIVRMHACTRVPAAFLVRVWKL
jgi:hypothetical protein